MSTLISFTYWKQTHLPGMKAELILISQITSASLSFDWRTLMKIEKV